jgi:hypothetical protein
MLLALTLAAAIAPQKGAPADEPVRLVVLVVVDQMTADQLPRLGDWWEGGFKRFHEQGRRFTDAAFAHGRTETGPGHGTIGTGQHPSRHGLVSNSWVEADGQTTTYCVYDPDALALTVDGPQAEGGFRGEGRSPAQMHVPALGDYLMAADARSQIVAISAKDRGAVPIAGSAGGWALWWDRIAATGFMSSTAYGEALPDWVVEWNEGWFERLLEGPFGDGWHSTLPADEAFGASLTEADERPGEHGSGTFPHALPALSSPPTEEEVVRLARAVYAGPGGDEFVLDLAEKALTALELGADEHVDLLSVSLSSCDTVGHDNGPRSHEVTDVLLRADRRLGQLFEQLDERVGAGRWIAVLTADHGVLRLPESLASADVEAGRASSGERDAAIEAVRAVLTETFGGDFGLRRAGRGLRFSARALAESGHDVAAIRTLAADELARAGAGFVAFAYSLDELRPDPDRHPPDWVPAGGVAGQREYILTIEARSFDEERTPDVVFTPHRNHLVGTATGTSHGSPWEYDRRVPLVFLGPGFKAGTPGRPAGPVDIVPTLLARLGLDVPDELEGAVLLPR